MRFSKARRKDIYLGDTPIENFYINELMPSAPGDFVKVYLYGRLYAETGEAVTDRMMAAQLALSEARIAEAWKYWEVQGAVRRRFIDGAAGDCSVEFCSLKEQLYGGDEGADQSAPAADGSETEPVFGSSVMRDLMLEVEKTIGRTLSRTDSEAIISWVEDTGATPEVVLLAVKYSMSKGKSSFRYIGKVLEGWVGAGCNTADSVNEYLEDIDRKHFLYRRVMKSLGFTRNPSEEERRLMDAWFDELGFTIDKVLEACSKTAGISNPNIKYVDSVLRNWTREAHEAGRGVNEDKPVSMATLNRYYEYLRARAEREASERRAEVYRRLPKVRVIDERIKALGLDLSKALIMGGDKGNGLELNQEIERLNEDRAILLTENDYDMDYTDVRYLCRKCNDTGFTDMGEQCSCMAERMQEAGEWQKSRGKGATK